MFTLSPDGKRIAFQLRRGDPDSNSYCLGMFILDLQRPWRVFQVDSGGELILEQSDQLGRANAKIGTPLTITPKWSPDGQWIAFLKRMDGVTQIWRARSDGTEGTRLSRSPVDVDRFAFNGNGSAVIYASRPGILRTRNQLAAEGKTGYHFDDRFFPSAGSKPFPRGGIEEHYSKIDLRTNHTTAAMPALAKLWLDQTSPTAEPTTKIMWRPEAHSGFPARSRLVLQKADGQTISCQSPSCSGEATLTWHAPDFQQVYFLRREGWARSETAVYIWTPQSGNVRRVYRTRDLLFDCVYLQGDTICVVEGSLKPRRIVRFSPSFRKAVTIFDPNPEFRRLTVGRVQRLQWKNAFGIETFGDLVLPVSYDGHSRYPLVVAQYTSRGFLRGGTGGELPIQALANRGFAVLSVQRPDPLAFAAGARDAYEVDRKNLAAFRDRRSVLSSIEVGVKQLVDRGIVDAHKVGISGLSDGSSTVQFAALNSRAFAAASVSGCCWDPYQEALLGPAIGDHLTRSGWPQLSDQGNSLWRHMALTTQARRVEFPILMQMADEEYLIALPSVMALTEARKPVDLYVFPNEYHFKWQPAHKQAVYDRNVAWFEFWLKDIAPSTGPFASEVSWWRTMRSAERRRSLSVSRRSGNTSPNQGLAVQ